MIINMIRFIEDGLQESVDRQDKDFIQREVYTFVNKCKNEYLQNKGIHYIFEDSQGTTIFKTSDRDVNVEDYKLEV
jgi:hypothetical protein